MKWIWIIGGCLAALVAIVAVIGAMLPKGHRATRSARFRQSPDTLYRTISGPSTWRSDVRGTGALPDGRWWEQDAHNNKVTFELLEDRPPTRRVTRIADKSLPFGGTWTIDVVPASDCSTVRITEDGEVYNVIFRFMARFVFGYTGTIETYLRDLGRTFGETVQIEA